MKLLIDTNVALDVLLKREPFYQTSAKVLELTENETIQEYISAAAITDIYYIAQRQLHDRQAVRVLLKNLLSIVSIAAVSGREINYALTLPWPDFEDSVQYSIAAMQSMDGIVTRNPQDYQNASLPVWQPEQVLQKFNS